MVEAPGSPVVHRLHPMTLLQRLIVSLPALVFLLLPFLRSPDTNAYVSIIAALAYALFALPLIILQYVRFRYWITEKEVVIRSGVITRQHRNIPIERIQNIEIEQSVLPRLFGTAKVKIETAGSTSAEGVLEYVALEEAQRIREIVRAFQQQHEQPTAPLPVETDDDVQDAQEATVTPPSTTLATETEHVLLEMPLQRVLLSGAFRFSLLYIALAFSALQYFEPDFDTIIDWFERGRFAWIGETVQASPWLYGVTGALTAIILSWLTGILVNLNKYYRFRLWRSGNKLQKRGGLLTLAEGTIPLKRVQSLIMRTNLLMRRYGWYTLELQTMGSDVQQNGHQMAVPFAQKAEILSITPSIYAFDLPQSFDSVSPLTIRRHFVRGVLSLFILVLPTAYFWSWAWWFLLLLPLLLLYAFAHYRTHGYALNESTFFIKRGVFRPKIWIVPLLKMQVFYSSASLFQRRLGLKSLHIDTAGAADSASSEVTDIPDVIADDLLNRLYEQFQDQFRPAEAATVLPDLNAPDILTLPQHAEPEANRDLGIEQ